MTRSGGVRVTGIELLSADAGYRNASYVKVSTDAGVTGWSEYYPASEVDMGPLIRRYGELVMEHGIDPRSPGVVSALLNATTKTSAGGLNQNAIAAIENACVDIQAKALGVPVSAMLGGPFRTELPLYWTHCGSYRVAHADLFERELGAAPIRRIEDLVAVGAEARAAGFGAVKTNPISFGGERPRMFSGGFRIGPDLMERTLTRFGIDELREQLSAMREGLGPGIDLMLDLSFSQRTEGYQRIARALADLDLRWLEFDSPDAAGVARVRNGSPVPIASGEALYGLGGYRHLLEREAVDVLLVDVMWNGFWQSQRVATLADAYQVNITPHCPVGHLGLLMSAQFAAGVPNFDILEYRHDEMPWTRDFLTHPPRVENGVLTLPTGPGWGSDIDEEALAAHPPLTRAAQ